MSDDQNYELSKIDPTSLSEERNILFLPERGGRGPQALIQAYIGRDEEQLSAEAPVETVQESPTTDDSILVRYLPVSEIRYSRLQIREVDEETLTDLARSIQERGVIQPVLVRPSNLGGYELIAGERRLRAARLAGLNEIPALVTDVSDQDSLELAIIENAQREDLNPVEEALAYRRLTQEFSLTQNEVAQAVGKSRVAVANSLRLLQLPEDILELLRSNELSAGHGKALLAADGSETQSRLARTAVKNALSVRGLERLIQALSEGIEREEEPERESLDRASERVANFLQLERVKLRRDAKGRKVMTLTFDTEASWKRFISRIRE